MKRNPGTGTALLLAALLVFSCFVPALRGQTPNPLPPTPQELDQLLSPIALYPDSLLAQITTASTNPQEILDVNEWLIQNQNLSGTDRTEAAQQQGFDPAFIALVNFPDVLQMMAEHIDDYAAIGQAVLANQDEVTNSIQRLRARAYASGALESNPQQQVQVEQSGGRNIYVIQPANPQVVYVPQYDPTVVYVGPSSGDIVTSSLISFGMGIGIGALLTTNQPWGWDGWGWNWGDGRVNYNHNPWRGWHSGYRPPHYLYQPRPVVYGNRPGYRGNWNYRPYNYRPPTATHRSSYTQPVNVRGNRYPGNQSGTVGATTHPSYSTQRSNENHSTHGTRPTQQPQPQHTYSAPQQQHPRGQQPGSKQTQRSAPQQPRYAEPRATQPQHSEPRAQNSNQQPRSTSSQQHRSQDGGNHDQH